MGASITIKNLGPIKECSMQIDRFTVLTGAQASGKSTIAKCVYLCRTIKDDFLELILKAEYYEDRKKLVKNLKSLLRNKFLRMFGTSLAMSDDMVVNYQYRKDISVTLSILKKDADMDIMDNYVGVMFSQSLLDGLSSIIQNRKAENYLLEDEINKLFDDEYKTIYIPAGRSLISLLTSQLNYLYITMDERQKRMMDYTTQKYIEYILKIRPLFANGLNGLLAESDNSVLPKAKTILKMINGVLKGRYVFSNGTELFYINDENYQTPYDERFVKINFTSSGQQETVWIFNILFYVLINKTRAFIIVEEPEAHLYPDAQKKITEILAFMNNCDCQMMITTHSPYVLGSVNNLIYAYYVSKKSKDKSRIKSIVNKDLFVKNYSAFQVEDGIIQSCIESSPEKLIMNEVIDGASREINDLYDKLFDLENE